jgi:hypothetical protein
VLNLKWLETNRNHVCGGVNTINCHMNDSGDPVVIRDSSPDLILLVWLWNLQSPSSDDGRPSEVLVMRMLYSP